MPESACGIGHPRTSGLVREVDAAARWCATTGHAGFAEPRDRTDALAGRSWCTGERNVSNSTNDASGFYRCPESSATSAFERGVSRVRERKSDFRAHQLQRLTGSFGDRSIGPAPRKRVVVTKK